MVAAAGARGRRKASALLRLAVARPRVVAAVVLTLISVRVRAAARKWWW